MMDLSLSLLVLIIVLAILVGMLGLSLLASHMVVSGATAGNCEKRKTVA